MKLMRTFVLLGSSVAVLSTAGSAQAGLSYSTHFRVARHANVTSVPSATYDAKFIDATYAISEGGVNDVPCDFELRRHDTWWFSGGASTDVIWTETDHVNTLYNVIDAWLNVVNVINWCGTDGTWAACADEGGGFLITRDALTSPQGGLVVAHEFGHTVGLDHDDSKPYLIMRSVNGGSRLSNTSQCIYMRTPFPTTCKNGSAGTDQCICSPEQEAGRAAASNPKGSSSESVAQLAMLERRGFGDVPIEELAFSFIIDKMPVEVEDFYGQQDVDVLVSMLQNPDNRRYARTIVA